VPITVFGFFDEHTRADLSDCSEAGCYYPMHTSILSFMVFDDDPFVAT